MQEEGGRPAERGRPPHLPLQFKIRGLFCRRVQRDEGIPPYGRPGGCGYPGLAGRVRKVCRGGPWPSRRPCGSARSPGRCEHRPLQSLQYRRGCGFPVGRRPTVGRRGGIYPSRGHLRQRRARRDEGIPPYGRPDGCGCPVWPVVFGRFVGEGHGPPGDLAAARGPRDDASIVPYRVCNTAEGAASRLAADPPLVVGEGFIPPADTCGSARSPGRCKHRPLQRFAISQRVRLPGWRQALPFRRGGFHIRPRVFAAARGPAESGTRKLYR